jgi:hypothetical protein
VLAERQQAGRVGRVAASRRPCQREQTVGVEIGGDLCRGAVDQRLGVLRLTGRHQPEMPRRQRQARVARQDAEHWKIRHVSRDGFAQQSPMPRAGDAVEDHPGKRHSWVVAREPGDHCSDRGTLPRSIDDQRHGPAGDVGEFGGRAGFAAQPGSVEETHHTFAQHQLGGAFEVAD